MAGETGEYPEWSRSKMNAGGSRGRSTFGRGRVSSYDATKEDE